jgi:hypothetical protein
VAHNKDKWQTLVNSAITLQVQCNEEKRISSLTEQILVSKYGLCSVELVIVNGILIIFN